MERIRAAANSPLMRLAQKMIVAGALLLDREVRENGFHTLFSGKAIKTYVRISSESLSLLLLPRTSTSRAKSCVPVDNSKFFRIRSKTTHNPDLVDLVQSEHAKRVIMFGVQKPVDMVGGTVVFIFFL